MPLIFRKRSAALGVMVKEAPISYYCHDPLVIWTKRNGFKVKIASHYLNA